MRHRVIIVGLVVIGLLTASASADAARPIPGGRYQSKTIAMTVSDSGRGLSPQGAELLSFAAYRTCVDQYNNDNLPDDFQKWILADRGITPAGLRIDRRGRFAIRDSLTLGGGAQVRTLTLSGRFVSPTRAVGRYRIQIAPRDQPSCGTGWLRFRHLRFTGERHLLSGSCNPPRTRTLLKTTSGRIYEEGFRSLFQRDGSPLFSYDLGTEAAAFGCVYKTRKRYFLATTAAGFTNSTAGPWSLSGRYAAVWEKADCVLACFPTGNVINLADGRERHAIGDSCTFPDGVGQRHCDVYGPVVNSAGSVAWISVWNGLRGPPEQSVGGTQVHKIDTSDQQTLLDEGPGIERRSLRLHGSVLSWRNRDLTKTATLD